MSNKLYLLLVLYASLASAYTLDIKDKDGTPLSTVTWTMRESGPRAYTGFYITTSDSSSQTFSMAVTSGVGNEVAITGGGCTNYPAACSGEGYNGTPLILGVGTHQTVGVGTPSYTLRFTDIGASNSPVDITFNVTVVAKSEIATFTSPGAESNCSNSDADYLSDDTCTVSDWRPDQTSFSAPGVGSSYTDGTFGATVTQLCDGCNHGYSAMSAFNADSTKIYQYDQDTSVRRVVDLSGNVKVNDVPGGGFWDASDSNVYYYCDSDNNGQLQKVILDYGGGTWGEATLIDFTGDFGAGEDCNNGGTGDTSANNWMTLSSITSGGAFGGDLCVVNLTTSDYTCEDISGISEPFTDVDFPLISKGVDSTSGKMYAIIAGQPRMGIWSFAPSATPSLMLEARGGLFYPGTVDYDGSVCTSSCLVGGHSDTYQDDQGNQYWATLDWLSTHMQVNGKYGLAHLLRAGDNLRVPIEAGGGMRIFWLANLAGDTTQGQHTGCAKNAPYCYFSLHADANYKPSYNISDATNAEPIKITTTAAHGYVTDDKVNIGGVEGNTAANGVWTVILVDADEFTLNGTTGNGAYTSGGVVGSGEALTWFPYREQQIVFRLGSTEEIRRVAVHRTQNYTKPSGYFHTPRGCMSPDGTKILWDTNFGLPMDVNVVFAGTGVAVGGVALTGLTGRASLDGGASIQ